LLVLGHVNFQVYLLAQQPDSVMMLAQAIIFALLFFRELLHEGLEH
jgi:hypothetical protein